MDSSALLDAAVCSRTTPAEQDVKTSPIPVTKSKKTSLTAKLKSPAPVIRAKKLSLDKTTAEKGTVFSISALMAYCCNIFTLFCSCYFLITALFIYFASAVYGMTMRWYSVRVLYSEFDDLGFNLWVFCC